MSNRLIVALVLCLSIVFGSQSRANDLVVDLSKTVVPITTSFTGSNLLLFGSFKNDNKTDIIVVVRGPFHDGIVRQKKRVLGVWANGDEVTFEDVPAYYYMASNRPVEEFLNDDLAKLRQIGIDSLDFSVKNADQLPEHIKANTGQFRAGLVRNKQADGLFGRKLGNVHFKGDTLFRTDLHFPANVPVGEYGVDVYAIRDNKIIGEHTTILAVQKFGLEAGIYDFAHRNALAYGLIAIILATAAGWLASVLFRKS